MMHEALKQATGITDASCNTCPYIEDVSDGWEYGLDPYYICSKPGRKHMSNLKGFPFKTDQSCWVPDFWVSKFSSMIKTGEDEELDKLHKDFHAAVDSTSAPGGE